MLERRRDGILIRPIWSICSVGRGLFLLGKGDRAQSSVSFPLVSHGQATVSFADTRAPVLSHFPGITRILRAPAPALPGIARILRAPAPALPGIARILGAPALLEGSLGFRPRKAVTW